jgi:hypothetical protein
LGFPTQTVNDIFNATFWATLRPRRLQARLKDAEKRLGLIDRSEARPAPTPWLVEGAMRQGVAFYLAGIEKAVKTGLTLDLVVSLASATPWLGRFAVPKEVGVAYCFGEETREEVERRLEVICRARGLRGMNFGLTMANILLFDSLPRPTDPESMMDVRAVLMKYPMKVWAFTAPPRTSPHGWPCTTGSGLKPWPKSSAKRSFSLTRRVTSSRPVLKQALDGLPQRGRMFAAARPVCPPGAGAKPKLIKKPG